jgi:quercetin dioxygenase-like cupin family protein
MTRAEHIMAGRALRFGLDDQIASLRAETAAGEADGGRNAITLVKDGSLRVVLVVLGAGKTMDEHATPGPATVQVLEGRVRIAIDAEQCVCERGAVVVFQGGVDHTVTAEADSALLLTVVDPRADREGERGTMPHPRG